MNYIKAYKIFEKELGYVTQKIDIRFDIRDTDHYQRRKGRHGADRLTIEDDEAIELIEKGMEKLTIDLMSDHLDVNEEFILKGEGFDGFTLNLVCKLNPGKNYFTLVVVTVMREEQFRPYRRQYILDVDTQEHTYG